jgi:lipooligosaccharide transport system ATP-binding protein
MEEAARLCDRVAIMNQGSIVTVGTPQELTVQYEGKEVWEIEVDSRDKTSVLNELNNHHLESEDTGYKILVFHATADGVLQQLQGALGKVLVRPATLEDVFFKLTGRSLAE